MYRVTGISCMAFTFRDSKNSTHNLKNNDHPQVNNKVVNVRIEVLISHIALLRRLDLSWKVVGSIDLDIM